LHYRIRFFGVDSPTGVGTHCSETVRALKAFSFENIEIQLIRHNSAEEVNFAIADSLEHDVNIYFFPEHYAGNLKGIKIYWCVFDASRPNPGYQRWLDNFHYIFATSHWGQKIMVESGLDESRIFVIPEGVDGKFYHPYDRPVAKPGSKTKFLMVGKYEEKKGYAEAFEALKIAANQGADVELLTKSDWVNGTDSALHPRFIQMLQQYRDQFPIVVYTGNVSRQQMRMLYYSADYFLYPSRCEGWGLPLIEAIACGTPCISTKFGGHSEYLGFLPDDAIIRTTLRTVDCPYYKEIINHSDGDYGLWAYPDVDDLARRIREAAAMPRTLNLSGSNHVRQNYSWDLAAEKIMQFLHRYLNIPNENHYQKSPD